MCSQSGCLISLSLPIQTMLGTKLTVSRYYMYIANTITYSLLLCQISGCAENNDDGVLFQLDVAITLLVSEAPPCNRPPRRRDHNHSIAP